MSAAIKAEPSPVLFYHLESIGWRSPAEQTASLCKLGQDARVRHMPIHVLSMSLVICSILVAHL